jgi:hypothetical protein
MKGMRGIAVFVFAGLLAHPLAFRCPAQAVDEAMSAGGDGALAEAAPAKGWNEWELGPEIYLYDYNEPGLMKYDGALIGFGVRFTHFAQPAKPLPPDDDDAEAPARRARPIQWVFRAEGRYAAGSTDYDGQLQDGTPASINNVDATSYEGRALFGLSFPGPEARTTVFLGMGYRFKDDDSSFSSRGYKRESTYSYIPAVLEYVRPLNNDRELAFTAEYDLFLSGDQVSDLSTFGAGKITNSQTSGWGVRASIAYSGLWRRFGWTVEPFVRYWNIEDSESVYLIDGLYIIEFIEPKNTTTELGVATRIRF